MRRILVERIVRLSPVGLRERCDHYPEQLELDRRPNFPVFLVAGPEVNSVLIRNEILDSVLRVRDARTMSPCLHPRRSPKRRPRTTDECHARKTTAIQVLSGALRITSERSQL
jgi:hypothetical protein